MEKLSIADLREECIERGLETNGKKKDLIQRLRSPTSDENFKKHLEQDTNNKISSGNSPSTFINNESRNLNNYDLNFLLNSLPALTFDKFKGDPYDYPRFKSQLDELILNTPLSDAQKLTRLIQLCDGEAKNAIRFLEGIPGGLKEALNILHERYGESYLVVFATIERVTNIKSLSDNDKLGLRRYADQLRCAFYTLKSIDQLSEVNTYHLQKIASKLSYGDQVKWRDLVSCLRPDSPSFERLCNFIQSRANALNEPVFGNIAPKRYDNVQKVSSHNTNFERNNVYVIKCVMCSGEHKLMSCERFSSLSLDKKRDFVARERLCYNCLGRNHTPKDCRSKIRCLIRSCGRSHHTLLHPDIIPHSSVNPISGPPKVDINVNQTDSSFLQVVPINISNGANTMLTYALLDSGSEKTFISQALSNELNLEQKLSNCSEITLSTLTGAERVPVKYTSFEISSSNSDTGILVKNAIVIEKLNLKLSKLPKNNEIQSFDHLKSINFPKTSVNSVQLIIGTDVPKAFVALEYLQGKDDEPIGIKTLLGWSIIGPSKSHTKKLFNFSNNVLDNQLELILKTDDFTDNIHETKNISINDIKAIHKIEKECKFENGHFVIPMLWNEKRKLLLNNRDTAAKRSEFLKVKFTKDKSYYQRYSDIMKSYFENGYARIVSNPTYTKNSWYLPHHGVINPRKPEKLRIVFDAAAKSNGLSVNDCLYQGPDLLNCLIGVLCRFREEIIAITGDIEAMFHQVKVTNEDTEFLKFLWWVDGLNEPIVECSMQVHIFGAKSSPCIANFALKKVASSNSISIQTANSILRNFYVDDFLKSVPDVEQAKSLTSELVATLKLKGFNLTKLISNSAEVFSSQVDSKVFSLCRTLGITWCTQTDTFKFSPNLKNVPCTKRGILSASSQLFDPLGFLAPVVLVPKLILQTLWKNKYNWDDEVTEKLQRQWCDWLTSLESLCQLSIPRCLKLSGNPKSYEIHAFSDASECAFGTSLYLRTCYPDGSIHVSFIFGKSKIAPLKYVSIPRLELQAAVLAARCSHKLRKEFDYPFEGFYFWTDSSTTLCYIKNNNLKLSTYVANRVTTILELTDTSNWYFIPGKLNPADDASRGFDAKELNQDCRWLKGPSFLRTNKNDWPNWTEKIEDTPIEVMTNAVVASTGLDKLINYSSSYFKLKKSIAWLRRFAQYKQKDPLLKTTSIDLNDLDEAESFLIKYVQSQFFSQEIGDLKSHKRVKINSPLYKLSPFFDNFILRVGGRIKNAPLAFEQRHQAILPHNSYLSKLIIRSFHEKTLHSGKETTISSVRTRFWILRGTHIAKAIIKDCVKCRKLNAIKSQQLMGNLPKPRVTPFQPPFSVCGVDLFGPFLVTIGRKSFKRYGVVFICFATKAIHIEVCPSLEADDFINTLIQFISRRGVVKQIWSDNGTNFTLTQKIISDSYKKWLNSGLKEKLLNFDVNWKFNPAGGSHMGGLWERSIRSIKRALAATSESRFTDHSLKTYFCLIENILNDRPLVPISDDANDLEVLTPNHFLMLRKSSCQPIEPFEEISSRKRWQYIQTLANHYWKRWLSEYLPTLQKRSKWLVEKNNIKIGDIVLIRNENTQRGDWPLGRVVNSFADDKGVVRSVELKTKNSIITRPIHKLCLLEEAASVQ